jgi:spore germination protein
VLIRVPAAPVVAKAAVCGLALVLLGGCGGAARGSGDVLDRTTTVAERTPVVTGYALAGSATPSDVTRDGDLVDVVGVDGVSLLGPRRVSALDADAAALRRAAAAAHRRAILLVSNYDNRIGDFNERRAHRMLSRARNRAAVVRALVRRSAGFGGIQVDLESLRARDRRGLTRFTKALRRALPRGKAVSMAFMASGNAAGYAARGYDLSRLSRVLDVAVLMTYDQHGPWSGPGPIAALPWVRRELGYVLTRVPRAKVDLGAAAYGYRWGGGAPELTVPQSRAVAGSRAQWDATDGEWHASLPGGRTLWWDDARSVELRRRLAASEHLHGLAVWQLGSSGSLR